MLQYSIYRMFERPYISTIPIQIYRYDVSVFAIIHPPSVVPFWGGIMYL